MHTSIHQPAGARARLSSTRLLAALFLVVVTLGGAIESLRAQGPSSGGPPAALVQVNPVREEPIHQTVPIQGRAVARESGLVAAMVPGPVMELRVHVGDRVKRGEPLVIQDDAMRRAELARRAADVALQQARVATATARLDLARQELSRFAKLKGSAAFPKASFEDKSQEVVRYRSELTEMRASLDRAAADHESARIALGRTIIRAPYDGVVTQRHTAPGAYLQAGDRILSMLNDLEMELEIDVPSIRLGGLQVGKTVSFSLDDDSVHEAVVRAIIPDENPLTRTRQVRLTPKWDPRSIASNQSVMVQVPVGADRQVISVHKDAIISRSGKRLVYVVEDDAAQMRPVRLGEAVGGRFEVLDGLKPGDLVVVRGNERLRPGQRVRFEMGS